MLVTKDFLRLFAAFYILSLRVFSYKVHFTELFREIHTAFQVDGFLLTFAGAPDPFKANLAYELDKIVDYFDWINIMTYDYSGPWDNFTGNNNNKIIIRFLISTINPIKGIDQPLYGRWGEGFVGHPKYQFNIHETVQHYLKNGIPPEKIAMGIHTESKAKMLNYRIDGSPLFWSSSLPELAWKIM